MAKKNLSEAARLQAEKLLASGTTDANYTAKDEAKVVVESSIQEENKHKNKKVTKKGFSFRGNPEDVMRWQNYGMAIKNTHAPSEKFCVDELWCAAIEDYIKKHPLSGKAKELYDEYTKA